jgi:hypothetical protein
MYNTDCLADNILSARAITWCVHLYIEILVSWFEEGIESCLNLKVNQFKVTPGFGTNNHGG